LKREGDGASPAGPLALLEAYYRADRVRAPKTILPQAPITQHSGWCDAPADRNYNRLVRLPYQGRHEALWREDHLYDIVVVLGYNIAPRKQNGGSAIFLHCARQDFAPTAGCIAVRIRDLYRLLEARPAPNAIII
jgi:L,D-peptidoglycan transpeptidase YkuD (ErfK/YbiS/YcfS/YnhG family)